MAEPFPSALLKSPLEFEREVTNLCKKYGYHQHMVAFGEATDQKHVEWRFSGNGLSEGLCDAMEDLVEWMRSEIKQHGHDSHPTT